MRTKENEGLPERRWSGRVAEDAMPPGEKLRADRYIADVARILTRSQLKARGAILRVNGKEAKLSRQLEGGDTLEVFWTEVVSDTILPERIDVPLIYEDDDVFVFDKPQGMVTHPAAGNWSGTLANASLWLDASRKGLALPCARGGIVHRLDKDTSGLIIVARNAEAQNFLASQFKNRTTKKEYVAFVRNWPRETRGRIENLLSRDKKDRRKFASSTSAGKHAVTDYKILAKWELHSGERYALLALYPRTGRTHQLRVHLSEAGCPIVGDPIYGIKERRYPGTTLLLHARRLSIILPGKAEHSVFAAPVPERFAAFRKTLDSSGTRID